MQRPSEWLGQALFSRQLEGRQHRRLPGRGAMRGPWLPKAQSPGHCHQGGLKRRNERTEKVSVGSRKRTHTWNTCSLCLIISVSGNGTSDNPGCSWKAAALLKGAL